MGILSIKLFFLVGILLLFVVELEKGKAEAHAVEREAMTIPTTEGPSAPIETEATPFVRGWPGLRTKVKAVYHFRVHHFPLPTLSGKMVILHLIMNE